MQPGDRKIFDDEAAGEQMNGQAADVDRTFDFVRRGALRVHTHRWPEIHGQRHDEGDGDDRRGDGDADADVPEDSADARAREHRHWMTTSSVPASTGAPSRA